MDVTYVVGELITIGAMAFAFSMDSFSIGLGLGLLSMRMKRMALISTLSGFFHMVMPLIGIIVGQVLSVHFGQITILIGGGLLIVVGISMFHSAFQRKERETIIAPYGIGLLLFAFTVSIDSISAGLSLGMFGARVIVTVVLFGVISTVLTMSGLLLGRKFYHIFGRYSLVFGGSILLAFGIKMVFI